MPPTILVVDDDPGIRQVIRARLESAGYTPLAAETAEEALSLMAAHEVALIISDVRMPGMGGQGLLREVVAGWPGLPVILLTAYGAIPDAVAAVKEGAADYLTKPFDGKDLIKRVRELLDQAENGSVLADGSLATDKSDGAAQSPVARTLWGGASPVMAKLHALVERVAPSEVSVLISGESGTGKELVARALHELSNRSKGPFVVVDCGATPAGLLESELFGHVKGSFTHALKDRRGLIEEAKGGTLFLDEIGTVSPEMQTRLLRFLQERTIRRIGESKPIPVDCRVLSATNADLPALVREGGFREDLFFRLKGVALVVPPLRERAEDIPLLARRFLDLACREEDRTSLAIPEETMDRLKAYSWPGNVRELRHAMEAGAVLAMGDELLPEDLQLDGLDCTASLKQPDQADSKDDLTLHESEKRAIIKALEKTGGIQTKAADLLGISRRAIHYKIKKFGISIPGRDE